MDIKENNQRGFGRSICILLSIFTLLLVGSFMALLLYANQNYHKINEELKSELYDAKQEIKDLRDKNRELQFNSTFNK